MLLFRSEEAVREWCEVIQIPFGALLTVEQGWELGRIWYQGRLDAGWRPLPVEEKQKIFHDVGLRGPFWALV